MHLFRVVLACQSTSSRSRSLSHLTSFQASSTPLERSKSPLLLLPVPLPLYALLPPDDDDDADERSRYARLIDVRNRPRDATALAIRVASRVQTSRSGSLTSMLDVLSCCRCSACALASLRFRRRRRASTYSCFSTDAGLAFDVEACDTSWNSRRRLVIASTHYCHFGELIGAIARCWPRNTSRSLRRSAIQASFTDEIDRRKNERSYPEVRYTMCL